MNLYTYQFVKYVLLAICVTHTKVPVCMVCVCIRHTYFLCIANICLCGGSGGGGGCFVSSIGTTIKAKTGTRLRVCAQILHRIASHWSLQ